MTEYVQTFTVDCPHCNSSKVIKKGVRNEYQTYHCKDCDRRFTKNGNPFGSWNKAEHIGAAVDMYYSGMSYKQIAELLGRNFGIPEPSKATIYRWVKEYSDYGVGVMQTETPQTSGHWVADEMQLKVGGQRMWNWNVMDRDTRYVLASHLSPYRGETDAVIVFEKALKANGGVVPETVTTDGLGSYGAALGLMLPPPNTRHIVAEGIYEEVNNNLSERLQGTFRDRTKTLRGLEGRRTGQKYLDGWVVDYNVFRDHEAHKGGTPAVAAGADPKLNEWTDLVNAVGEFKAAENATRLQRQAEARTVASDRNPQQRGQTGSNGRGGRGGRDMRPVR